MGAGEVQSARTNKFLFSHWERIACMILSYIRVRPPMSVAIYSIDAYDLAHALHVSLTGKLRECQISATLTYFSFIVWSNEANKKKTNGCLLCVNELPLRILAVFGSHKLKDEGDGGQCSLSSGTPTSP